jgi:spermidine synthase
VHAHLPFLSGAYGRAVEYVEVARSGTERGELVLRERRPGPDDSAAGPTVLELRANGIFVMDTSEHTSEAALADAALDAVAEPRRVLIGGLGLGFTLDRVLGDRRVEHVDVVEIESALVEWMRDGTIPHGRRLLADSRVRVVVADLVRAVEEAGPSTYDVVLLDVDNGPDHLVHDANAVIYDEPFLRALGGRLERGGALVVWSAARAAALAESLRRVFDEVTEHDHPVRLQDRDEHYWLYSARRPAGPAA